MTRTTQISTVVIDKIPLLISRINKDLVYLYVNDTYERWFNRPTDGIIGKTMTDLMGPEYIDRIRPHIEKVLAGETVEFEESVPGLKNDRSVLVKYVPDTCIDGEVQDFIVIVSDISELKQRENLLLESEQRLNYALEATGEGVWDWKVKEGRVLHNARWCELLGLDQDFLEHSIEFFSSRIHPEDAPKVLARLTYCLEGRGPYSSEHRILHENGDYLWVVDRGRVTERDAKGNPVSMVGSCKDMTEIRQAHARLEGSAKMASLGEMASSVAHEINNPLAILSGRITLLLQKNEKQLISQAHLKSEFEKLLTTIERISTIVSGLRTFSRNSEKDAMSNHSLSEIISEVLALCKDRLRAKGVTATVKGAEGLSLYCRPGQVQQVLINLIGNSIDAIENLPNKWIELVAAQEGSKGLKIRVTDSGEGISADMAKRIMDPFYTTKPIGKGTGLGLSISKNIIQQHGGDLNLDPQSPHTSFVIELPCVTSGAMATKKVAA